MSVALNTTEQAVPTLLLAAAQPGDVERTLVCWANSKPAGERWTLIVRGGDGATDSTAQPWPDSVHVIRLAPDCACCTGQLVLKTHLARTLRLRRPDRLFIEAALDAHLAQTLQWLGGSSWTGWIGPLHAGLMMPLSWINQDDRQADLLRHADLVWFSPDGIDTSDNPARVASLLLAARQKGGAAQWRVNAPAHLLAWPSVCQALGMQRRSL